MKIKVSKKSIICGVIVFIIALACLVNYVREKDITSQDETYYQYIDETGKIVSDDEYFYAGDFGSNGIARVEKYYSSKGKEYKKVFFINTSFEDVTDPSWDKKEEKHFSYDETDSDYIVYTTSIPSDTLKIMDPSLKVVAEVKNVKIEDDYKDFDNVHDGLIKVRGENGLFGYADVNGEWKIEPQFDDADSFKNGIASVRKDGLWGGLDTDGNFVIEPKYWMPVTFGGDGEIAAAKIGEDTVRYIDRAGNEVISKDFVYSKRQPYFSDGMARVFDEETNLFGYIDTRGEYVIEPRFEDCGYFRNGTTYVAKMINGEKRYGLIDKEGNIVLDYQFDNGFSFNANGLAVVVKDGLWGIINTKGEYVVQPQYKSISGFSNGYAVVEIEK